MSGSKLRPVALLLVIGVVPARTAARAIAQVDRPPGTIVEYRIERLAETGRDLYVRFTAIQLTVLEKLNRTDVVHLPRLDQLVVPSVWYADDLQYSPFPLRYPAAVPLPKLLVVDQPAQAFAAYEEGRLVRWGPVSSGRRAYPTPSGLFHLNWRSRGRHSTVNPQWYMKWYFNFENARGLALHSYTLPGYPASHACVRLLERDAIWIYGWGEGWTRGARGEVVQRGTPLLISRQYAFGALPPWRSLEYLARGIELPDAPLPNHVERDVVEKAVGRNQSSVAQKSAPGREVERLAVNVGDTSTRLLDEQRSGSLIPNRFAIVRVHGNSQQQFGGARSQQHMLRLTVHQNRRSVAPEFPKNAMQLTNVAVARFAGVQRTRPRRVGFSRDRQPDQAAASQ